MWNGLGTVGKLTVLLAAVLLAASIATSTGAFSTANLSRPSSIQLGADGDALVGVDATSQVSVACAERLVTVTNNFDSTADVVVAISEDRDGELSLTESRHGEASVSFELTPGDSETVYVTKVRGPIWDDVEFDVAVTTTDTEVSLSKRVPKVPGNEDEDDDDGNWGGDGCGDDEGEEDEEGDDDDEDDD